MLTGGGAVVFGAGLSPLGRCCAAEKRALFFAIKASFSGVTRGTRFPVGSFAGGGAA